MNEEKIKAYSAWFESELALHKIAKGFLDARVITQYHMDCENKYEWFVGDTENDFVFNVSRKHNDFKYQPIHILTIYKNEEPSNETIKQVALAIAKVFNTEVNLGFINYISGDNFEYETIETLYNLSNEH